MLTEHTWPQARGQLKDAWHACIQKNFVQAGGSGGPVGLSCKPSKLVTPQGSPLQPPGAGGCGQNHIKYLYSYTSVACKAV